MSSLLFYNVENIKHKEKPLNEQVCPNFWLEVYISTWECMLVQLYAQMLRELTILLQLVALQFYVESTFFFTVNTHTFTHHQQHCSIGNKIPILWSTWIQNDSPLQWWVMIYKLEMSLIKSLRERGDCRTFTFCQNML